MKTGLILEGGAMRGMFTAGVIDVMMENGIKFDGAIGVSAGAAFGCNYKSNQPGRVIRYNKKYCRDKRYCSIRSLIKTGDMYGADFCYHEMPEKLDIFDCDTFRQSPMEFYAVCTDLVSGKPVYKRLENADYADMEWLRASASMPLASRIVELDGYCLLDGGISDSIPLKYFESIGYDRNIVVLTQPRGYVKGKNKLMLPLKISLKKYPAVIKALADRHIMYNETIKYIEQKEKSGEILVIRPEKALEIGRTEHNPDKLERVYQTGRLAAEKVLGDIITFLNK